MNTTPECRRPDFVRSAALSCHRRFKEAEGKVATQVVLLEEVHLTLKWRHKAVIQLLFRIKQEHWFRENYPLLALADPLREHVDSGVLKPGAGVYFAALPLHEQDRYLRKFLDEHVGNGLHPDLAKDFLARHANRYMICFTEWKRSFNNRSRVRGEFLNTADAEVQIGAINDLQFLLREEGEPPASPEVQPIFLGGKDGLTNPITLGLHQFRQSVKALVQGTRTASLTALINDPPAMNAALGSIGEVIEEFEALRALIRISADHNRK